MGTKYAQLSLEERCEIAQLHKAGASIRQIAAVLDRSPSSISRELKRNRGQQIGYKPVHAQERAKARRWKGSKLERNAALRDAVLACLSKGWSPEQTCAWLERQHTRKPVSPETIYRFIAAQITRHKDYSWRHYLPRAKAKRGWRGPRGASSALHIKARIPIAERPVMVEDRSLPGHWEADLMLFSKYGQAILALHERSSRLLIAAKPHGKAAKPIAKTIARLLEPLPAQLRQSITFDNGTEFARHYELHGLNIATFFCDPYAPWQKGGIENAIGRMRKTMPRKTDLDALSPSRLATLIAAYNNTPRKCLDWKTPAELFSQQLLHFKCESTSPPSRGRR
jgi:IS30 family transposase